MSDKQAVLEAVSQMPENLSMQQINEELATLEAIRRGLRASDEGRVKAHEEVKRLVLEGTSK